MGEADPLPDPHPGLWVLRPGGKEEASQGASPAPPNPGLRVVPLLSLTLLALLSPENSGCYVTTRFYFPSI